MSRSFTTIGTSTPALPPGSPSKTRGDSRRGSWLRAAALLPLTFGTGEAAAQFANARTVFEGAAFSVAPADVDADGDVDVVFIGLGDAEPSLLLNEGAGSFGDRVWVGSMGAGGRHVHAADLDGDGHLDVVVAGEEPRSVSWYQGRGDGSFGERQEILDDSPSGSTRTADLDGDGDPDIVSWVANRIFWLENLDGLGAFGPVRWIQDGDFSLFDLSNVVDGVADLDGDGDVDVVGGVPDSRGYSGVGWYENDSGGGFVERPIDTYEEYLAQVESVAVLDVDGDGDPDVVTGLQPSAGTFAPSLNVYHNDGGGAFSDRRAVPGSFPTIPQSLLGADVDRDGDGDLIGAWERPFVVTFHESDPGVGADVFHPSRSLASALFVAAADVTGDGLVDLVATTGWSVLVIENTGRFRPRVAPGLLSPSDGSTGVPRSPDLRWGPVAEADSYGVEVALDSAFASPDVRAVVGGAEYAVGAELLEATTYFWRVRAANDAGVGPWSRAFRFDTAGEAPSAAPTLRGPPDGAADVFTRATLRWSALASARAYELELSPLDGSESAGPLRARPDTLITVEDTTATVDGLAPLTSYGWRVRGSNAVGAGPWSDGRTFTTNDVVAAPSAPPPDLRTTGVLLTRFEWGRVRGASGYALQIDTADDFSVNPSTVELAGDTSYVLRLRPLTTYYWRVSGTNPFGAGPWTEAQTLATGDGALPKVTGLRPGDGALSSYVSVRFRWEPLDVPTGYIGGYGFDLSKDPEFGTFVRQGSTRGHLFIEGFLDASTTYYWRVAVSNPTGTTYSDVASFATAAELPPPPTPGGPVGDGAPLDPTLMWEGTGAAGSYEARVDTTRSIGVGAPWSAVEPVWAADEIAETSVKVEGLEPDARYYWRVRSWVGTVYGHWSLPQEFTTSSGTVRDDEDARPDEFALGQNAPNPAGLSTRIEYGLPEPAEVTLTVYDAVGRRVSVLARGPRPAGRHAVTADTAALPAGVYVYELRAGPYRASRRMVVVE